MPQQDTQWSEFLELATQTDVGMRRSVNQDSMGFVLASDQEIWIERGHLFVVADGMGAHAAGELASKLAVDNIPHTYHKLTDLLPPAAMEKSILDANALIHGRGQADPEFRGMGTTCSALLILPQGAICGHVGDSRIYRLRGNRLEQLSFDHSLVWEMEAAGHFQEGQVPSHIPKNVITRSLGPNPEVQVDIEGPFPIEPGDTFLLCSDGLTGPVKDEEVGAILGCLPIDDAVQTLIDLANLRGGPDNITAVALRVKDPRFGAGNNPIQAVKRVERRDVLPAVWVVIVVCALLAAVLAALGQSVPAGACGLIAILAVGFALMQKMEPDQPQVIGPVPLGGPYGKGPHRAYDGVANKAMVTQFAEMIEQLRSAAEQKQWPINWQVFLAHREEGEKGTESNDETAAIRGYCAAIRSMLREMRKSGGRAS